MSTACAQAPDAIIPITGARDRGTSSPVFSHFFVHPFINSFIQHEHPPSSCQEALLDTGLQWGASWQVSGCGSRLLGR